MTCFRLSITRLIATLFIGLQICGLFAAPAQALEEAMLIIDASRSMWGQIEGENRIVIARNVLSDVFQRYETRLKLGLMAYGNRSQSNCSDINQLKRIGLIDAARYSKAVRRINPRGKTPIARSLQLTARRLDYKNKKTTLILLSDGLDNCRGNPCTMAKTLEESGNYFTVHVIAFSVPKVDHPGLSCIARNTGGKFFAAKNEAELSTAFTNVIKTITTTPIPIPQEPPKPALLEEDKAAAVAADVEAETRKMLDAMQARAQSNQDSEISRNAEVRSTTTVGGTGKIIRIERSNRSEITNDVFENPLKPVVLVISKDTNKGSEALDLTAKLAPNGPSLSARIKWEIYNFIKSRGGKRAQIATSNDAQPTVLLAPGKYIVRVVFGNSSTAKVIKITEGQITDATFILNTGGLRVKPLLIAGTPPKGKEAQQWLYLVSPPESPAPSKLVATANNPKQIHQLTAGIYELISRYGTANAIVKTNVVVTPGLLTDVEIGHKAGIVRFKLVKRRRGGAELEDVTWQLFDADGNEIIAAPDASTGEIIAPGKYQISARHKGIIYTKTFRLKPGKTITIQVIKR